MVERKRIKRTTRRVRSLLLDARQGRSGIVPGVARVLDAERHGGARELADGKAEGTTGVLRLPV